MLIGVLIYMQGKSTDQRKPFGCAITRYSFPPKKILLQHRMSNHADKSAKPGSHEVRDGGPCVSCL